MAPKPNVEYAKVVGPADRHSVKSCALLSMIASDAALGSTIPSQLDLMLKLRVLFLLAATKREGLETSRQFAFTVRCSDTCLSAEADAGQRNTSQLTVLKEE